MAASSNIKTSAQTGLKWLVWLAAFLPLFLFWTVILAFATPREEAAGIPDLSPGMQRLMDLAIYLTWALGAWIIGRVLFRKVFSKKPR